MQTDQIRPCIKISQTGKGLHHWENQLLDNQQRRIRWYLESIKIHHTKVTQIIRIFEKRVTKDNIVKLHGHSIETFLVHLLNDQLEELSNHTSITQKS